ncbi:MAG: methylmalonyl-CoA epimerase [Bacteroidetes bacterium]|nr:methylmalonyl-CoA epimerase [Bacteroidota bacterium]
MFLKVEHIGIAVKNLNEANTLIAKLFDKNFYKQESVERESVTTSFFQIGETKIELLEATKNDSAISKFIEKKGEGIHHLAFEVADIRSEMKRLESLGFQLLSKEPLIGADNKIICFLHPKTTNGILVELCQEIK